MKRLMIAIAAAALGAFAHAAGVYDNFLDAYALPSNPGTFTFSNEDYTLEGGEPVHSPDGWAGGASGWAKWTPSTTGDYTFWLYGTDSNYDTQLAVYTGDSLGSLTLVASNDDLPDHSAYSSVVSFRATAGVTYRIAMDAYEGWPGTMTLRWAAGVDHYAQFDGYGENIVFSPASGSTEIIVVKSSANWSVTGHSSWITPKTTSGSNGSSLSFTVAANTTGATRTGTLTLTVGGSKDVTLSVWQQVLDYSVAKSPAVSAATAANKRILLIYGREGCWNTRTTFFSSFPTDSVKRMIEAGYVVWYSNCDRDVDGQQYTSGLSGTWTLPLICILNPKDMSSAIARTTGYHDASAMLEYLQNNAEIKSCKITFDATGGSVSPATKTVNTRATYGTLPTPTWGGHTFTGWYEAPSGDARKVTETTVCYGDTTVYARWTLNQYKLTYNANGGSVSPASKMVTYCATYGTLPTPTWSGHTFQGWFTAKSGGTKVTSSTKCVGNATIYAQWKVNQYKLSYSANGGTVSPAYKMVNYCATYGTLPTPTWGGHTFQGWFTAKSGGTQVTSSTKCVGNATIYARWKVNQYKLSYSANGGTVSPAYKMVNYCATYGTLPTPTWGGHTFNGWFTAKTGGTQVTASTKCIGNATIYARWTVKQYTITFDANGGKVSPASQKVNYCATYSLPTPTWSGHTFKGWYTAKSGGTKVTSPAKCTGNATLYARW